MLKISIKPYFLRAIYEWCMINNYTPHISVIVDTAIKVPMQFIKNKKIIFNISPEAIHKLTITNEFISFRARFNSVLYDILVPIKNVISIYTDENKEGIEFSTQNSFAIYKQYKKKLHLMSICCNFLEEIISASNLVQEKLYSDSKFLEHKKKLTLTRIK